MNITNKTVLVTGANRGIGLVLVNEALRRGAKRVYAGTRGAQQNADKRVIPLTLDVTNASQIKQAAGEVDTLDVLINNAGVAIYDDLSNFEVIEQHLVVNLFGILKVTRALSAAAEALPRGHRQQPVLGSARPTAGHSRVLHFEGGRAFHDAVAQGAFGGSRRDCPCRRLGPHRY